MNKENIDGLNDLMVSRAFKIARHSIVKEEADRGTLLENRVERLGIKKE